MVEAKAELKLKPDEDYHRNKGRMEGNISNVLCISLA